MVIMARAQAPPSRNTAMKALTGDKTAALYDHPLVTQSLDLLVEHFQNKGYTVSQVRRDVNPDGTLKHYSFQGARGVKKASDSEHMVVGINMGPTLVVANKQGPVPMLSSTPSVLPVSDSRFMQLLKGLSAESFDEGKISYVMQVGRSHHFTSAQTSKLLSVFDFDDERVNAAVALYPYVVDHENFPAVLKVFSFDDGRETVIKKLKM